MQRNPELVEHLADLGVDLVHAVESRLLLWCRPVADRLIVDGVDLELGPVGLLHRLPRLERLQAPLEQPFRLALLRRNQTHGVFGQAGRSDVGVEIGAEAELVAGVDQFLDALRGFAHSQSLREPSTTSLARRWHFASLVDPNIHSGSCCTVAVGDHFSNV